MFQENTDPKSLDQAMRNQLSGSLKYLFDTFENKLNLDAEESNRALNKIRKNKVSSSVFARYYELVFAIRAENFKLAQQLAHEILSVMREDTQFEIIPYSKKNTRG